MKHRPSFHAVLVAAAFGALALAGCAESGPKMSKEEAEDKIFAPTDVEKMSPEMKAKIPGNALGPGGGGQPGAGATPPPNLTQPRSGG
jgi:hypothetical protein